MNIYIAEYTQDTGTGESATRAELVETCRKKISAETEENCLHCVEIDSYNYSPQNAGHNFFSELLGAGCLDMGTS